MTALANVLLVLLGCVALGSMLAGGVYFLHRTTWKGACLLLLIYCCWLHSMHYVERQTLYGEWQRAWTSQAIRRLHEEYPPMQRPVERQKFTKPLRFPWQE